jgi:hypothetical protein
MSAMDARIRFLDAIVKSKMTGVALRDGQSRFRKATPVMGEVCGARSRAFQKKPDF